MPSNSLLNIVYLGWKRLLGVCKTNQFSLTQLILFLLLLPFIMPSPSDETNFWKVASVDESEDAYWHAYEATRPNYADDNFLDIVYDYHSSKDSSSFTIAHDVGCGSGVAAAE